MATLKTKILLRNDTKLNWENADKQEALILGKGEVGIEIDTGKMKLGDGATRWSELAYFKGDIDLTNLEANNVYFGEDIVFTEPVGTVTIPSSGSTTVKAQGVSLDAFLKGIFAKEDAAELKKSEPSVSVRGQCSSTQVEVGTTITPKADAIFEDGKYKYGPEPTGSTASAYKLTSVTTGEVINNSTATFQSYKFTTEGVYKVKAECDASVGANPKSNIGTEYSDQKIVGGHKTSGETTICSAYIPNFYGHITSLDQKVELTTAGLTSQVIRGLQHNQKHITTPVNSYDINEKWAQFIYALPAGRKTSLTAKDGNNITFTVQKITSCVVELQGGITQLYDVFVIDNAALYGATKVQMSWK